MSKIFPLLFVLGLNSGFCQSNSNLKKNFAKETLVKNMHFPSQFEVDSLSVGLHELGNAWYSQILDTLGEPKIFANDSSIIYRLLYLKPNTNPLSIRIEKYRNTVTLTTRVCSGNGSYFGRPLNRDTTIQVRNTQFSKFEKLIIKANYWNVSTYVGKSGKDGSKWILEASTTKHYHVVDRWSAKHSDRAFYNACKFLLKLSGLRVS